MKKQVSLCLSLVALPALAMGQGTDTATKVAVRPTHQLSVKQPAIEYPVRTFPLHRLTSTEAGQLLSPYVRPPAFLFAGANQHELTVSGPSAVLTRVDSVLREEDKPARTIVFRFELILASDSAFRDPATSEIDSALRDLFRFKGYRLLAQGTVLASEYQSFELTLGSSGAQYKVSGRADGAGDGGKGTLPLNVFLYRVNFGAPSDHAVLSTGVTIPLGQTVVLGSAARGVEEGALILTVHPELQTKP